jgi:hypothetical protein
VAGPGAAHQQSPGQLRDRCQRCRSGRPASGGPRDLKVAERLECADRLNCGQSQVRAGGAELQLHHHSSAS